MNNMKIGLLPLYLELYDQCTPDRREYFNAFLKDIVNEFEKRDVIVSEGDICRLAPEFSEVVAKFEREDVDAIVTLHLAYSPSLESADVFAKTRLPIIVFDTSPTAEFPPSQDPANIMYNHGIHGVMDMCNLLKRNEKPFAIEAGHWSDSDVIDRVVDQLGAIKISSVMRNSRVGLIGSPFQGMGDFQVAPEVFEKIGMEIIRTEVDELKSYYSSIEPEAVTNEMSMDCDRFIVEGLDESVHRRFTADALALRAWLEDNNLNAFTMNFRAFTEESPLSSVPFLEASKAMGRGIGYAGEGDVLTAAFAGAIMSAIPETCFIEIFCADWKNNQLFLSHMGEVNVDLVAGQATLIEKDFPYTSADNPVVATGALKPGDAVFVNLAPMANDRFKLILSPVKVMEVTGEDRMKKSVRGWIQPETSVNDFLAAFSREGGTHHQILCYGNCLNTLKTVAANMDWDLKVI